MERCERGRQLSVLAISGLFVPRALPMDGTSKADLISELLMRMFLSTESWLQERITIGLFWPGRPILSLVFSTPLL